MDANAHAVDILVVGGGVSGVCAAIAAARNGTSVALIESSGSVGGITTEGPLEALMTFHDDNGQIIGGIAGELVDRLVAKGGSPGFVPDTVGYCRSLVPYDSEILRLVLFESLREAGVDIWLNTMLTSVEVSDGVAVGAEATGNSSSERFAFRSLIDASGGADAARLAGAGVLFGRDEDHKVQPMSTLCKVAGVDIAGLRDYVKEHPEEFKLADNADLDSRYLHLWGFGDVLKRGYDAGRLSLFRSEIQLMTTPRRNEVILNFSRYSGDPRLLNDVSDAQIATVLQCHELVEWLSSEIPAFDGAHIVHTGKVGIRESRRVRGLYELQPDDIIEGRGFPHVVAQGTFPVDIHQPDGTSLISRKVNKTYGVPMESLISADISNLFMCGRCVCASHEALASVRITAAAMATGHAAGIMASAYARYRTVEYEVVRKTLREQGAIL